MYGWRGRLGLIVPSSNTTMEMELHSAIPEGVSLHTARVPLRNVTEEELIKMNALAVESAKLLRDAGIELILYGCTSGSFIGGKDFEKELEAKIENEVNVPVVSTSTAVVEALKMLDAQSILVITPYTDEINEREKEFLEANDFEVLDIRGLGIEDNAQIGKLEPYEAYRLAKATFVDEADAIFISCTNLRTFEIIEPLEEDLGVPVVTSNQASLWLALREMDVMEKIPWLGRLLTQF
ncbi:maleate cis-trans isomerase [Thermococcus sp. GR7]|uniref:maleate cis-trans isomerase family protein n=1 Tax=unclassified Thermococcus TaxID=2627626 RepID=UPI001430EA22|nr:MULTISPECIES: aspartate/glutamate racemase family protein [unclassified Thermococcus]NJE47758.1 maleate cis-trans isomerase [Thermococcus sp. GR7]NJE78730.1 maleate cis-trans isomerase [Thermococcus sp. GR4]NJF22386.1 maleate cis-trans isomerase [Thermococcus sp. GR5]